jgi:ubiquinone/menaquinone biosynthesis C-methylase UbiE
MQPPEAPDSLLHRIVAIPAVYDLVQKLAGRNRSMRLVESHLRSAAGGTVLEVGAGTGMNASLLPPGARYLWLDHDPQKLAGFRARMPHAPALLCDGTRIALRERSVDVALCIAVSHHLTDSQLAELFCEIARVCRTRLVFLDAVARPDSLISRIMWRYDRGSHPRSPAVLQAAMERYFEIEHRERYVIYHEYLLCVGRPKHANR